MKSFIGFFTSNFGLKVLALVLAIIVYYAVRDSLASSRFHPDAPIFKSSK